MSFDVLYTLALVANLGAIIVAALACVRGVEMGRAFVNGVYRRRAFWIAAMLFAIELSIITSVVPAFGNSLVGAIVFSVMIVVIMAFVDGVILVAQQTDFFHRDIGAWQRLRWLMYTAIVLSVVLETVSSFYIPSFSSSIPPGTSDLLVLAYYQFDVVVPVAFIYAAVVLAIGTRRTPDRTLKTHIRFLGVSLALFVGTFVLSTPDTELAFFISSVVGFASIYFLYKAVMALSPVGRITALESSALQTPGPSLGGGTH